jgi:AcrR family transcriptional regulator
MVRADPAPNVPEAVVAAAIARFARRGVDATTLDHVADEIGLSRASLYRAVPGGKDALIRAVLVSERRRLLDEIASAVHVADPHPDATVASFSARVEAIGVSVGTFAARHPALPRVILSEPDLVVPFVAFHSGERFLAAAVDELAPHLAPVTATAGRAALVTELLVRQLLSHVLEPSPFVAFGDSASVTRWLRTFVLPGLVHLAFPDQGAHIAPSSADPTSAPHQEVNG